MPCKHTNTKCIDSRAKKSGGDAYRRRRYQCLDCGLRFSTVEVPVKMTSKKPAISTLRSEFGISDEQREAIAYLIETFMGNSVALHDEGGVMGAIDEYRMQKEIDRMDKEEEIAPILATAHRRIRFSSKRKEK